MSMRLSDLAAKVGGQLIGDGDAICVGANPLMDAGPGEVTMIDDVKRSSALAESPALVVVTPSAIEGLAMHQIVVASSHEAFSTIVKWFRPPVESYDLPTGIDATAQIAASAKIHPSVVIGEGVVIGERCQLLPGVVIMPRCVIGDDCTLFANVTLYEHTRLGDRVVIHSGSVLGANGFGYRNKDGRHIPTGQLGYVDIASDVELGACVTIDRGTYGATRVGEGTKIDNQVMIGHNCHIGRHNLICSQVGIAGSCTTGDYVVLAGQVGLKDHIHLGDGTIVGAQAGVMEDCEGGQVYLGSPATIQRDQMQIMAVQRRLPDMRRDLKSIRRELDEIQAMILASRQRAA